MGRIPAVKKDKSMAITVLPFGFVPAKRKKIIFSNYFNSFLSFFLIFLTALTLVSPAFAEEQTASSTPEEIIEEIAEEVPILPEEQNQELLEESEESVTSQSNQNNLEEIEENNNEEIVTNEQEIKSQDLDEADQEEEIAEEEQAVGDSVGDEEETIEEKIENIAEEETEEQDSQNLNQEENIIEEQVADDDIGEKGEIAEIVEEKSSTVQENTVQAIDMVQTREQIRNELMDELKGGMEEKMRIEIESELRSEFKNDCLELDGIGYYCLKNFSASTTDNLISVLGENKFFEKGDNDQGDKEIYMQGEWGTIQITDNSWDDIFPSQDSLGNYAAWQSFVENKWQVFVYETASGTTTQITSSDFNNMNPQIGDGIVVWQGWSNNNWEIFMSQKKENIWETKKITENSWHDMFPKIGNGLITWQALKEGSWQVFAYNISTGEVLQISQGNGKFENPRFAIVWEERGEDGSIKILGYDLASGKAIPFAPPVPKDSPLPEQQEKALPAPNSNNGAGVKDSQKDDDTSEE